MLKSSKSSNSISSEEKERHPNLEPGSVEGDILDTLDGAVVQDVRHEEQACYLFNCWGLKQVER